MKRLICILLLLSLTLSLCSCGEAKQKETPQGESLSADIPLTEESAAPEEITVVDGTEDHASMGWNEELTSTNGEVKVSIHDSAFNGIPETMPVIAVQPKTITSEMLQQVAAVVFGDNPLYEYGWMLTRSEIEKRIAFWEESITTEAIRESHGGNLSDEMIESIRNVRQQILDNYREALTHAPEEVTPKECDWMFRPGEYWQENSHNYSIEYPSYSDTVPFGVDVDFRARGERDRLVYIFTAHNVERAGFWDHSIRVHLDYPGGISQTDAYEATGHLSDAPATDEELRRAEQNAEAMLRQMGLGEWICEAHVREMLRVDTTPAGLYCIELEGRKVREQWSNQSGTNTVNPPNGGWNESFYEICANDGTLFDLSFTGLLEDGISETAPLISREEAMDAARTTMKGWTTDDHILDLSFDSERPTGLTRGITEVSVGYYRKPTGDFTYELIPALSFRGTERMEGVTEIANEYSAKLTLLVIDLRDGSVLVGNDKKGVQP